MGYNNYKRIPIINNYKIFKLFKIIQFELDIRKIITDKTYNIINFLINDIHNIDYFLKCPFMYQNQKGGYYTFNCNAISFSGDISNKFNKMKSKGKNVFIFEDNLFLINNNSLNDLIFETNHSLYKIELLYKIKSYILDNWNNIDNDVRIL